MIELKPESTDETACPPQDGLAAARGEAFYAVIALSRT